ncbi:MAG: peptidoglycan-binding protein [Polyangiales bacterium]
MNTGTDRHVRQNRPHAPAGAADEGYEIDVDGDFGGATAGTLRDWSSNNDLTVDGIAGPDTWASPARRRRRREGSFGGQPARRPARRRRARPAGGPAELGRSLTSTYLFGDATDEAVREFQEENELDVDGVVGPLTWAALGF